MFADKTDIQAWIRNDVILVDDANSQKPNVEARRTIIGQLSGFISSIVLQSWADPDTTPEIIRSIAGRLAAAFLYRALRDSEQDTDSAYAQWLYNNAIADLAAIKTGEIVIVDDNDDPIDVEGTDILGWLSSDPQFTIDQTFS
jgi:hypothetical protein